MKKGSFPTSKKNPTFNPVEQLPETRESKKGYTTLFFFQKRNEECEYLQLSTFLKKGGSYKKTLAKEGTKRKVGNWQKRKNI